MYHNTANDFIRASVKQQNDSVANKGFVSRKSVTQNENCQSKKHTSFFAVLQNVPHSSS